MRVCLRWFPALVSDCLCMPNYCVSLNQTKRAHNKRRPTNAGQQGYTRLHKGVCAFDGFLLWVRIAYACPTTASLCNDAGQQGYTSHKRQSPRQAAVHASNQHTTPTSHRNLCHGGTRHRGTAPTARATGARAAHIQRKRGTGATPQRP